MSAHVMIDLETLSTRKNAAILQIAAVAFDPEMGATLAEFSAFVSDGAEHGHVDTQTVAWWLQQDAAKRVGAGVTDGTILQCVLLDLRDWFHLRGPFAGVWAHGASFDLAVLASALDAVGIPQLWERGVERDTRTLYALAGGAFSVALPDGFVKHDALWDARLQVAQVSGSLGLLRVQADRAEQWRTEIEQRDTRLTINGRSF